MKKDFIMSNKHTPAPWKFTPSKNKDHDGMNVFTITPELASSWNTNGGYPIARTAGVSSEANAHLIAAAPELLEALEKIVKCEINRRKDLKALANRPQGLYNFSNERVIAAQKAIKKAKGIKNG